MRIEQMAKKTKIPRVKEGKRMIATNISYLHVLEQVKSDIRQAQLRAAISATKELVLLYWRIGKIIVEKVANEGWGAKTLERLARDIKEEFPTQSGFSLRNLKYMRQFAEIFSEANWAATAAQIPWGHTMVIMDKVENVEERLWYIQKTLEHGWSRNVLLHWIDSGLYKREGQAITNFHLTLPKPQSDLAHQTLKNPYFLDFLDLRKDHDEKELEEALIKNIQKFLIELGAGFAFVGRQYRIEVSEKEYFIDLLFFNFVSRCFFIVELKAREFDPKDIGQLNFYLSAVDNTMKHKDYQSSIGILICKHHDLITVEYALQNSKSPIGVSMYTTQRIEKLPQGIKKVLEPVKYLEAELRKDFEKVKNLNN